LKKELKKKAEKKSSEGGEHKQETSNVPFSSLKKVEKPSREDYIAKLDETDEKVKKLFDEIEKSKTAIDRLKDSRKNVFDALNAELKVLKDLQKTTGNAFAERKAVLEKAKQHEETKKKLKEVVDAAKKSSKDTSDLSKAEKSENIDKKISQLEYYLATHSLSLREEKKCYW